MELIQTRSSRGVSPVVSVILLVAVTVILSAVIGTFVLDLGNSVSDGGSDVGISISDADTGLEAQVVTGTADTLKVLKDGEVVATANNVTPGTSVSIPPAEEGTDISFVTVTDGEESLVTSRTSSGTSGSDISFDSSEIKFTQA